MAVHILQDAKLWLNDVSVDSKSNTLEWSTTRETQDDTVFGQSARTMKSGLQVVQVSGSGFADMDTFDSDLFDIFDNATVSPMSASATGSDGDVAYTSQGLAVSFQPLGGSVGDMAAFSIEANGSGGVRSVRGNILHDETAETATGTGTARQLGSVSASESVFAALHVVDASTDGDETLDVVVESDDAQGFASGTTQLTFAQATGKTGEFLSTEGAITDDWWRVNFTIGGAGSPSFTFVVVVGIADTKL